MDFKVVNIKEFALAAYDSGKLVELEIEQAKKEGIVAIKFIHGYGSHGVGGAMLSVIRQTLRNLEKKKEIDFFILGHEWNFQSEKAKKIIYSCQDCYNDEDLNHSNPGITIVKLPLKK